KKYQVDAWGELYTKVCEVVTLHRPYVAALLDKDEEFNTERRTNFSYIQSEIKHNGKRLANGLWIEINQSADDIVRSCRRLLEKCGFSTDELKFDTVGD
ncbi:MAG: hypothetical protein LBO21_00040, partial [Synergistaceae bacterium]|nr:hypothetical protein [Synergistaceae bacterium]